MDTVSQVLQFSYMACQTRRYPAGLFSHTAFLSSGACLCIVLYSVFCYGYRSYRGNNTGAAFTSMANQCKRVVLGIEKETQKRS